MNKILRLTTYLHKNLKEKEMGTQKTTTHYNVIFNNITC